MGVSYEPWHYRFVGDSHSLVGAAAVWSPHHIAASLFGNPTIAAYLFGQSTISPRTCLATDGTCNSSVHSVS
jgi:hypothetical protein